MRKGRESARKEREREREIQSFDTVHRSKSQGILPERGRSNTVDLLIKDDCFVKRVLNIFNTKMSCSKLVRTRRSSVLNLPLR